MIRAISLIAGGAAGALALVVAAWYWADRHTRETDDE